MSSHADPVSLAPQDEGGPPNNPPVFGGMNRIGHAGSSFVLDPDFYRRTWRDVREAEVEPVHHYDHYGRRERRQCCEAQMLSDIAAVEASGVLALAAERGELDDRSIRNRLVDYFYGVPPLKGFSADLTVNYYPRTLVEGEHPFAFYCRHARHSWCFANVKAVEPQAQVIRSSPLFDPDYVLSQMAPELRHLDPALYYATEGFRARLDPSPRFSTRAYVLEYPDIWRGQINPLVHFEQNGRAEGRRGAGRRDAHIRQGAQPFRSDRPTLLICSNEAGRSGAPLVGLNLARHLGAEHNVISAFLRDGPLMDSFADISTTVAVCGDSGSAGVALIDELCSRYNLQGAVLNSVEGARIAAALKGKGVRVVSLIHDFPQYVAPFNLMARTITLSDRVVFPAEIVRAAALRELVQNGFDPTRVRNTEVRHQGRSMLPPVDVRREARTLAALAKTRNGGQLTVMGAGFVQPRKGVDLFIETARVLKHELAVDCRFIWVGAGYAPQTDLLTSAYLAEQIRASALEDSVVFIPELQDLRPAWEAADVFFMSSRLDPFPNVALDALAEGLPVVCFQQATGIAELAERLPGRVVAIGYNDTQAAARAIAAAAAAGRRKSTPALDELLSFEHYAADISRQLRLAADEAPRVTEIAAHIRHAEVDPMLLRQDLPDWPPLLELCGSIDGLVDTVSRAALNGVSLGRLRHGRTMALSQSAVRELTAGRARDVWSQDDYDHETIDAAGPLSAVLISEDARDIVTLAELSFRQVDLGRFAIVCTDVSDTELAALTMVAGKAAVIHAAPGDDMGRVADFIGPGDCLVISPVHPGADWKNAAHRLVNLRSARECGIGFTAAAAPKADFAHITGRETSILPLGLDRRLIDEDVCRLYAPARDDLATMIERLAAGALISPPTIWSILTDFHHLFERGWVLDEPARHARSVGYDLLIGREAILVA